MQSNIHHKYWINNMKSITTDLELYAYANLHWKVGKWKTNPVIYTLTLVDTKNCLLLAATLSLVN